MSIYSSPGTILARKKWAKITAFILGRGERENNKMNGECV